MTTSRFGTVNRRRSGSDIRIDGPQIPLRGNDIGPAANSSRPASALLTRIVALG